MEDVAREYLNVPVSLLRGVIAEPKRSVKNILHYCIYVAVEIDHIYKNRRDMLQDLNITDEQFEYGFVQNLLRNSQKQMLNKLGGSRKPYVGIHVKRLATLYKLDGNEVGFETIVFVAYLALRSIIQQQTYKNIQVDYLFSRMDGRSGKVPWDDISPEIKEWYTRRKFSRIMSALEENYGMIRPASKTRGITFSFKIQKLRDGSLMTEEKLETVVQKKRKVYREKLNKEKKKRIRETVKAKLNG
jgi:hypothetical protein